ncbi:MAG TPA: hypothetical protein VHK69_01600 [Chitinophagaceae bacterium]|jgi:hypothetical protein|nr:hypothetical protein [Chitinophagaceae bacterium]
MMKRLSTWINQQNELFWTRVVSATSLDIRSLCVFRILTGLFLLTLFPFQNFSWISESPEAFFRPPALTVAGFSGGFPGRSALVLLDLSILALTLCITLGIKARAATCGYLLLSYIGQSFHFSFGKIEHSILLLALLFCMIFSGWGRHLALVPDKERKMDDPSRSLSLLSVLICFGFFTAGFPKALHWIDFDTSTSGFAEWLYNGYYNQDRQYLLAPAGHDLPFWVFESMDYAGVLFELSPLLFLLVSRKAWRLWLFIACVFHVLNLLLLNIPFLENSIVYLAFINYRNLYFRIQDALRNRAAVAAAGVVLLVFVGLNINRTVNFLPSTNVFIPKHLVGLNLWFNLAAWVGFCVLFFKVVFANRTEPAVRPEQTSLA